MEDQSQQKPEPVWAIVANVVHEHPYGPSGEETRRGTRLFAPGSKIYCLFFVDGNNGYTTAYVVGRHRRSHSYLKAFVTTKYLANWGIELVYSSYVISQIRSDGTAAQKQKLEKTLYTCVPDVALLKVQLPTLRLPKQNTRPSSEE